MDRILELLIKATRTMGLTESEDQELKELIQNEIQEIKAGVSPPAGGHNNTNTIL